MVRTLTAKITVYVLHHTLFHSGVHIDAHRADFRAFHAVDAEIRIRFQPQRRILEKITYLPSDDHEGRHPAAVMAETMPSDSQSQDEEHKNERIINVEMIGFGDGDPVFRHIERIDGFDAPGPDESDHDQRKPGNPDEVLDPVVSGSSLLVHPHADILEASSGTDPAAESPSQEKRRDEQQNEKEQASGDDAFGRTASAQVRREKVERDGER